MNLQQSTPSIPPVHPDVQMKTLPFYDVLDVLIKPSSLGAGASQRYHQERYFIFALTPQQVREVCISRDFLPGGRRDYMVQIQLRFCLSETSCPQEDTYPNSLCVKVNGKLFPLPGYAPPPKNGVEQKRQGRPLNITSLVRLTSAVPNQISVTWAPEIGKTYSISVYLVRQLTSPLLLQRLRMKGIRNPDHSRALSFIRRGTLMTSTMEKQKEALTQTTTKQETDFHFKKLIFKSDDVFSGGRQGEDEIPSRADNGLGDTISPETWDSVYMIDVKEKLTADPDSEIATTSLRVSLMCPLGKMRLTVPCRAVTCSHLQCFDAALYLQMNEKKPTWICPVCDKKATYESLIIDGLFLEILNGCTDADEIKFQEDGSWCPMRPKKEAVKVHSQPIAKIEAAPQRQSAVILPPANPGSTKKADVIDLTLESSSSDDEDHDPPPKKSCVYISKTEDLHSKGVLTYQPSTMRVPAVQTLDPSFLTSTLAVPFHTSNLAAIPADMQSLGFLPLIHADTQHYRSSMYMDSQTNSMQTGSSASTSYAFVSSSSSHYESSSSSIHDSQSKARSGGGNVGTDGDISDIISLD